MIESDSSDVALLRSFVNQTVEGKRERLPPESVLSEELGVPRSRLRTALKRLEEEGLIWRHVGRGTFVGPRRSNAGRQAELAANVGPADVIEARLTLEPQLARLAATRARPGDLDAIARSLENMERAESYAQWKLGDERLHRSIAVAAHNAILLHLFDSLHMLARTSIDARIEQVFGSDFGPLTSTHGEHLEFVEAIRAHDPQRAEAAMRDHLTSIRRALFGDQH